MQKIGIILLVFFYLTGCSVSKLSIQNISENKNIDADSIDLKQVKKFNLTSASFFIQKADVEVIYQGEKQKFIATIKYRSPDSFMISLRSTTGIEAARIFLCKDSILINDRINRTFYFGSNVAAKKKYGISSKILPVLFGDLITDSKSDSSKYTCENGIKEVETFVDENKVYYLIDCKNMKSLSVSVKRDVDTKPVYIKFEDYYRLGGLIFAKKASISDLNQFDIIRIKYSKIEIPWEGNLVFVPGNNYERIEIR